MTEFHDLRGMTLVRAEEFDNDGERAARFVTSEGRTFHLYHSPDCCESVELIDTAGDLSDLIGSPILLAEEVTYDNESPPDAPARDYMGESYTWTFYKLATIKGSVTLRFLGSSNGYYSESVSFGEFGAAA